MIPSLTAASGWNMRYFLTFCLVLCYLVMMTSAKPDGLPMSLSISPLKQTVKAGSEVTVDAKLTNISDHSLSFFDTISICDYPIEVRDSERNSAPETTYKQHVKCSQSGMLRERGRNILVTLTPHESRTEKIIVTRAYDLRRSGTYTVRVFRDLPTDLSREPIPSNEVTVTVTE